MLYQKIFLITLLEVVNIWCSVVTMGDSNDNCVISLTIPKDSLKTSCNDDSSYFTQQKLRSVQSQLSNLRRDLNNLRIQVTYPAIGGDNNHVADRVDKLESVLRDVQANLTRDKEKADAEHEKGNGGPFNNRKKIVNLVRKTVRKELSDLKEEIKRDIHYEFRQQLKDDIRSELQAYLISNNNMGQSIHSEILFNTGTADIDHNERRYSNGMDKNTVRHYTHNKNALKKLERRLENEYEAIESAINNEVPDKPQSKIHQSVTQTKTVDMKKTMVVIENKVRIQLNNQTQKVKYILQDFFNKTESKLQSLNENLSMKFEELRSETISKEYADINERIKQIKHDVETLGTELSSLLQKSNMVSNEVRDQIQLEKVAMETYIINRMLHGNNPLKLELEDLQNKTKAMSNLITATTESQRQTQYSLQNFNATFKLKNFYLEENIQTLTKQIEALNMTLNPDYDGKTLDEDLHQINVEDTVNFVTEIKDIWPEVLENITSIVQKHTNDIDLVDDRFQEVRNKFKEVIADHSKCCKKIDSIQNEMTKINDTVAVMVKNVKKEALDTDKWVPHDFNHTTGKSGCFGRKYVKRTGYEVGSLVGVELCSEDRYKIYLGESLNDVFLNIGIYNNTFGKDHCEFVGAMENTAVKTHRPDMTPSFEKVQGYKRQYWGGVPVKVTLFFFDRTPLWYECGVKIP